MSLATWAARVCAACVIVVAAFARDARAQTIAFIQSSYSTPQSASTTVNVSYAAAQTAGNVNIVVVGWNDATAHVQSVTDTKGNAYTLAVGPTVRTTVATQSIYYAKNIMAAAAGANAVRITFDRAAAFVDVRIAEYRGLDQAAPLDVTAANTGSSTAADSGAATTRFANELIVGANLVMSHTTGPGAGFTSRVITSPDGDILEDRIVTATGSYSAAAPISPSAQWIMQMVAFKAAGSGGGSAPDLTLTKQHGGTFTQGQTGATYTLTARNSGTAATSGTVTVTDTLPASLTATALSGAGWGCTLSTLTCTRSDALTAGASYSAITLTVTVSSSAPSSVTNTAAVSGGGDTNSANNSASDATSIGSGAPPVGPVAFPLKLSANHRYLVDQNNAPFPILGRTGWFVISVPVADYQLFVDDSVSRGYNAIEMHVLDHDSRGFHPPLDGNNDAPFLKRLDGTTWNGVLGATAPDFTTPNAAYWSFVDAFLNYCASKGVVVFMFPAYTGFQGGGQGWMQEMSANGTTKMNAYGTWIATRYKNQGNIVWMAGGDYGQGQYPYTTAQRDVEAAMLNGMHAVAGQKSIFFSAEWVDVERRLLELSAGEQPGTTRVQPQSNRAGVPPRGAIRPGRVGRQQL